MGHGKARAQLKNLLALTASLGMMLGPFSTAKSDGWFSAAIDNVQLTPTNEIILYFESPTNHECGSKRVDYYISDDTHPNATANEIAARKSILAALLAWQAQGKEVSVYINGCVGTTGRFSSVINQ